MHNLTVSENERISQYQRTLHNLTVSWYQRTIAFYSIREGCFWLLCKTTGTFQDKSLVIILRQRMPYTYEYLIRERIHSYQTGTDVLCIIKMPVSTWSFRGPYVYIQTYCAGAVVFISLRLMADPFEINITSYVSFWILLIKNWQFPFA